MPPPIPPLPPVPPIPETATEAENPFERLRQHQQRFMQQRYGLQDDERQAGMDELRQYYRFGDFPEDELTERRLQETDFRPTFQQLQQQRIEQTPDLEDAYPRPSLMERIMGTKPGPRETPPSPPLGPLPRPGLPQPESVADQPAAGMPKPPQPGRSAMDAVLGVLPMGGFLQSEQEQTDRALFGPHELRDAPRPDYEPGEYMKGLGRGIINTGAEFLAGGAAVAQALGAKETAERWMQTYDALTKEAEQHHGVQFGEAFDSPGKFISWAAGALGEQTPALASMIASGGIGAVMGRLAAKGALPKAAQALSTEQARKVAKWSLRGAVATSAPTMGLLEGGGIYGEQREAGLEPNPYVALAGGAIAGALETAVPAAMWKVLQAEKLAGPFVNDLMKRLGQRGVLTRMAAVGVGAGASETLTELAQEEVAIQARALLDEKYERLGQEAIERRIEAGATGGLVGGLLGGAGGVAVPHRPGPSPQSMPSPEGPTPLYRMDPLPQVPPLPSQAQPGPVPLYRLGDPLPPVDLPRARHLQPQERPVQPPVAIQPELEHEPPAELPHHEPASQPAYEPPAWREPGMPPLEPERVHGPPIAVPLEEEFIPEQDPIATPIPPMARPEAEALPDVAPEPHVDDVPPKPDDHDYASTQFQLPEDLDRDVRTLSELIDEKDLAEDGRVDDPHVTLRYGIESDEAADAVRQAVGEEGPIEATLGEVTVFPATPERPSDVVKIDIESPRLLELHRRVAEAVPSVDTQDAYRPHITLGYVQPGLGERYAREWGDVLAGRPFQLDELVFSRRDGTKERISLHTPEAQPSRFILPYPETGRMPTPVEALQRQQAEARASEQTGQLTKQQQREQRGRRAERQAKQIEQLRTAAEGPRTTPPPRTPAQSIHELLDDYEYAEAMGDTQAVQDITRQLQGHGYAMPSPEVLSEWSNRRHLLRAARSSMGVAGRERGFRTRTEVEGQGGTPEVQASRSPTDEWYKQLTRRPAESKFLEKGQKSWDRNKIERAIAKGMRLLPNEAAPRDVEVLLDALQADPRIEELMTAEEGEPYQLTPPPGPRQPRRRARPADEQAELFSGQETMEVGARPIIGREVTPEEAPLFSRTAQEADPEQLRLLEEEAEAQRQERRPRAARPRQDVIESPEEAERAVPEEPTAIGPPRTEPAARAERRRERPPDRRPAEPVARRPRPTLREGGGVRTIGKRLERRLKEQGRVDLRGQPVRSAEDIAELAQVYRDPTYETLRVFYVKDGKLIRHEGVTSRLPSEVVFAKDRAGRDRYIGQIKARIQKTGADTVYLLHNHPSGNPTPSDADINMTRKLMERIPELKEHVVINHERYARIGRGYDDESGVTTKLHTISNRDFRLKPERPHSAIGLPISGPLDVMGIGKKLQIREGYSVVIYRGRGEGLSEAIQEVPDAMMMSKDFPGYIRNATRDFGAAEAIVYSPDVNRKLLERGRQLFMEGVLKDFVYSDKKDLFQSVNEDPLIAGAKHEWSKDLVGQGIPRERARQIRVAEEGAPYGQQTAKNYRELNRKIREEHKTAWEKAKTWMRRQFAPGGLLPESIFEEKIKRDSELSVIEFQVEHLVGQLERAIAKDYGVKAKELGDSVQRLLSSVLSGDLNPNVKEATKTALLGMRQYIDGLSAQYATILQRQVRELEREAQQLQTERADLSRRRAVLEDRPGQDEARDRMLSQIRSLSAQATSKQAEADKKQQTLETILSNIGEYVNRSYKAFDDPKWATHVPDTVLDAARDYLIDRYEQDGMESPEASRKAEVILNEILKHGTAYESFDTFIHESKLGAKDLSILMHRKKIAKPIRDLLGEYTDPRVTFTKSATKMGRLIWNQTFLDRMREIGMNEFMWTEDQKPPEATAKIAGDKSEVYAPLNGLWTTPEFNQALKDSVGKERMDQWYRHIVQMNGMVKVGKTVLSPTTAARNWMLALFFSLANGHFDLRHMRKSIDGVAEYFSHQGRQDKLEYLQKLKRLGVVYDTPFAGEMMRLLEDSRIPTLLSGKADAIGVKSAFHIAQRFYQYGDDFWKIIGFENEKQMLMSVGIDEGRAETMAAKRIRDTYPTYSMVGRAFQKLRRFPLAGTFVSFPAEIIRTTGHILRYAARDMKDPQLRPLAKRRIAGLAIASGFGYALQAMSTAWLGMDEDDIDAVRLMAAPWQKNSSLVFTGTDKDGKIRYFDISYMDPYNYWKRPLMAIARRQPWEDAAKQAAGELLEPFLGTDIAAKAIFEVLANKRETGSPIYQEHDDVDDQLVDIAQHLRKAAQPGFVSNLERTWKAIDGQTSPSGRKYDLFDEGVAWIGFRMTTLDPKVALYYRSFDFKDAKAEADKKVRKAAMAERATPEDMRKALETNRRLRTRAYRDLHLLVRAARKEGLRETDIRATLKNSLISKDDIEYILRGQVPTYSPKDYVINKQAERASALFGDEAGKRIKQRMDDYKRYQQLKPLGYVNR